MPRPLRPKLGQHLEWHGNSIRVVLSVPPALRKAIGSTKLRAPLATANPKEAETLKLPVLIRLRAQIAYAKRPRKVAEDLIARALGWRESLAGASRSIAFDAGAEESEQDLLDGLMRDEAQEIERLHGEDLATAFVEIAEGKQTPFEPLEEDWLATRHNPRTREARTLALRRMKDWCDSKGIPRTVEALSRAKAGDYVTEQFERRGVKPATANKDITALHSFWTYLIKKGRAEANPWQGQRLKKNRDGSDRIKKRPFTDEEATRLLAYPEAGPLKDMMLLAALSGMRISEIGNMKVADVQDGIITIRRGKTEAAARSFPAHTHLCDLIARRCTGKVPDAYLIHELSDQKEGRRSRAAPISQAFTRWRRKTGVDERTDDNRQSAVDFHSWRRWFIRKAVEAHAKGAGGFTPWTIADVVGHSTEDGPLNMTMKRYPGDASIEAKKACVEAVRLPNS
jgi:integrase